MANQSLKTIPLADLKVSRLNMRHGRKKPDISDILPSIRTHGLRQTLLVRKEGEHYGVVAGRRRLFALKQVAKETGIAMDVPWQTSQSPSANSMPKMRSTAKQSGRSHSQMMPSRPNGYAFSMPKTNAHPMAGPARHG